MWFLLISNHWKWWFQCSNSNTDSISPFFFDLGGVRAAGFIHSPILLRDAHVSNAMMHATDWLPTLLNLIGEKAQMATRKIDGFNIWNTLQNREESPRTEVLINIDPLLYKNAALRIGDWKLVNQSKSIFYFGLSIGFWMSDYNYRD